MSAFILLLCIVVVFSFLTTAIFMFITKSETVKNTFFALNIMLGFFLTSVSATSISSSRVKEIILSWLCLIPAGVALVIKASKGKANIPAKILALLTSAAGAVGVILQVNNLAFPSFLIIGMIAIASILVCAFLMFKSKHKHIQRIVFVLASFLGIIVTATHAVSITNGMTPQLILTWLGLIPMVLGIIITAVKRKPIFISKALVLLTSIYGIIAYFIL